MMGYLVTTHLADQSKLETFHDGINAAVGQIADAYAEQSPVAVASVEVERISYQGWMERGSDG